MARNEFPKNYLEEFCRFTENGCNSSKVDINATNEILDHPFAIQSCSSWSNPNNESLPTELKLGLDSAISFTKEDICGSPLHRYHDGFVESENLGEPVKDTKKNILEIWANDSITSAGQGDKIDNFAPNREELEMNLIKQEQIMLGDRLNLLWNRVEQLHSCQNTIALHLQQLTAKLVEQNKNVDDVPSEMLQLQLSFNRLKIETDEEQNRIWREIERSRSQLFQSLMFTCEPPSTDFNKNDLCVKPEGVSSINIKEVVKEEMKIEIKDIYPALLKQLTCELSSNVSLEAISRENISENVDKMLSIAREKFQEIIDKTLAEKIDKKFETKNTQDCLQEAIDRAVIEKVKKMDDTTDIGLNQTQDTLNTRLIAKVQGILESSGSVSQITSIVENELERKVGFLLEQPISQSSISKRIGKEIDLYVPYIVQKVAKDPNTVTTINKFLARDLGSYLAPEIQKSLDHNEPWILAQIGEHLASRIPDAIDKKEAWMKVKINAEIDQHLSTVTCKILDDPNVDVMIREKISESIDDVILDRISTSVEVIDFGALLSKQIDQILNEKVTEKFFEKLIVQKLDEKFKKIGDVINLDNYHSEMLTTSSSVRRSKSPKHQASNVTRFPRSRSRRSYPIRNETSPTRNPRLYSPTRLLARKPLSSSLETTESPFSGSQSPDIICSSPESTRSKSPKLLSLMWHSPKLAATQRSESPRQTKSPRNTGQRSRTSSSSIRIQRSQKSIRSSSPRTKTRYVCLDRIVPERSIWCQVFVGRLPHHCQERHLMDLFGKYGKIIDIEVKSGGFGFVQFQDSRDVDYAVKELDGVKFMGCKIRVEHARPDSLKNSSHRNRKDENIWRILIENVSSKTSWQDLKDFFNQFGNVDFVQVHENRVSEGQVVFANKKSLKNVLEKRGELKLHGKFLDFYEG